MLAERIGSNVQMVECSRDNIKITLPDDIQKAEKILSERISEEVNA